MARNFGFISSFLTLDDLSGYYPTINSCQLRRFRNEYLDEAEALPVYIWNVATWPFRELTEGLLSPRPDIEKIGTQPQCQDTGFCLNNSSVV